MAICSAGNPRWTMILNSASLVVSETSGKVDARRSAWASILPGIDRPALRQIIKAAEAAHRSATAPQESSMAMVIVDGISASGKSLLLQGLRRVSEENSPNFTKLHLSEHLTERFFERTPTSAARVHAHVARILGIASEMMSIQSDSPFAENEKIVTVTVERLFHTLLSREMMTEAFFWERAELIGALNAKCLLLVVPTAYIEERIALSLTHRNLGWSDYIERLGGLRGATSYFTVQQDRMLQTNKIVSRQFATEIIEVSNPAALTEDNLLKRILWG